jgi:RHS repeat-associated protein
MLRVPLQGSVAVEDARSLSTGARVSSLSGYVVSDARGSVLAKTRFDVGTPSFTSEAEYDAWGKTLAGYSTLSAPKHGFAGAEPDEAAGTYSFGARTYDPTLRRWLSSDPLLAGRPDVDEAVGPSLNLYAYADGNPVKNTDQSGFCPLCVAVVAAGATILLMGAGAPSDSKAAPPNLGIVLSAIPGPSAVAMGTGALLKVVTPVAERAVPALVPVIRALVGAEKVVAPAEPALAEAASTGKSAVTASAERAPAAASPAAKAADKAVAEGPALPESHWKDQRAPTQVAPGTKSITDMKPSGRSAGEVYKRTTHYDQFGRSVGQTHHTSHGQPAIHPNPHHHTRNPITGQSSGPKPGPLPLPPPPPAKK